MDSAGSGEHYVVGHRLAIKTTFGDDFEGHVLTYDKSTNIIENDSVGPTRRNLRFVKENYIKDCKLLGKVDDTFDFKTPLPDIGALRSREEAAIRQAEQEAERIGVNVSQEAQDIFDALSKTLPVRWKDTSIAVLNDVLVSSPYHAENVTGGTATANERVRKVLEFERKRLQNRGSS
ncbi:hypothetical protein R1sor_003520 [Riccia sorocarpa]|uniref:AD domain-containing protein n=1 Tax=Riccia sorocarpa TaxID=122646 RepID=A0ABD3H277_9MARC